MKLGSCLVEDLVLQDQGLAHGAPKFARRVPRSALPRSEQVTNIGAMRFDRAALSSLVLLAFALSGAPACSSSSSSSGDAGGGDAAVVDGGGGDGESDAGATWSKVAFDGSIVASIASDPKHPSTVFVGLATGGAEKGAHRSTDGGKTWSKLGGGLPDLSTSLVAVSPVDGSVIANPGASGLWRSTNGGDTWSQAAVDPGSVNGILHHPSSGTVWAVTSTDGVYRSPDNGATWVKATNTNLQINQYALGPLAYDGAKLYLATEAKGVWVSTDGGDSWAQAASAGLPNGASGGAMLNIVASPTRPGVVFLQTNGGGIFRSNDSGASFTKLDPGPNRTRYAALRLDPSSSSTLLVSADETNGGAGGLLRSADDGAKWVAIGPDSQSVVAVEVATDGVTYAGTTGQGVWRLPK